MTDRKTVLVDLDNVVYPFAEVMANVIAANTELAQTPDGLMKLHKSWAMWEDWGIPKGVFDWYWEKAIENGAMWGVSPNFTAPPIPGAETCLWQLNDAEWHIHIATTRLVKFRLHDTAVKNTVEWLAHNAIPYRSLSFVEDKAAIQADAIIDDQPNNLLNHPAPIKLLYPAPHNQEWREDQDPGPEAVNASLDIHILTEDEHLSPWTEIVEILGSGER